MTSTVTPAPGRQTFPKSARLLRRAEFLAVQANGRRLHTQHFVLQVLSRNDAEPPRLGVTTSRKVGNANVRNRVRRLVREVFRLHRSAFPVGSDCVVIVRETAPWMTLAQVREELLGVLTNRGPRPKNPQPSRSPQQTPGAPTGARSPREAQQGRAGGRNDRQRKGGSHQ